MTLPTLPGGLKGSLKGSLVAFLLCVMGVSLLYRFLVGPELDRYRHEKTVLETRAREAAKLSEDLLETARSTVRENTDLKSRLEAQEKRLQNIKTTTQREIVRMPYPVPGPSAPSPTPAAPGPSVVVVKPEGSPTAPVLAQLPGYQPGLSPSQIVEVIRETIHSEERNETERTEKHEEARQETRMAEEAVETRRTVEAETKKELATRTEHTETERKQASNRSEGGGRFGLGVSDRGKLLGTYDFYQVPLELGPLKMGRLGGGVFAETHLSPTDLGRLGDAFTGDASDLLRDYGLQGNYSKGHLGFMLGYGVKSQQLRAGVIYKF